MPTFSQTPTTQHRGSSSSQHRGSDATAQHRHSDTQSESVSVPGSMNEILERAGRESCESITKWIAEQQQAGLRYLVGPQSGYRNEVPYSYSIQLYL